MQRKIPTQLFAPSKSALNRYIRFFISRGRCKTTLISEIQDGSDNFPHEKFRPGLRLDFGYKLRGWYMLELCITIPKQTCTGTLFFHSDTGKTAHSPITFRLTSNKLLKRLIHLSISSAKTSLKLDIVSQDFQIIRLRMVPVTRRFAMSRMLRKIEHTHLRLKTPLQIQTLAPIPTISSAAMEHTYSVYRTLHELDFDNRTIQQDAPPISLPKQEACKPIRMALRVIAFYHPHIHSVPQKNPVDWQWNDVLKSRPLFVGHYQPHEPDEYLGFYDSKNYQTLRFQIELAKQYGIGGFCFHIYCEQETPLHDHPLGIYLTDPTFDLPFCICLNNNTPIPSNLNRKKIDHSRQPIQNDLTLIHSIAQHLRDPRYIRINSRPLLLIYRPDLIPDIKSTSKRWREWCRSNTIGEIYLAFPHAFGCPSPEALGFDAAIEFPPNNFTPSDLSTLVQPTIPNFMARVHDWKTFVAHSENYQIPAYTLFRGVCPSWDDTARKNNQGTVFLGSTPELFTKWLINAFNDMLARVDNEDEQIVFINAWNAWLDGAHLEPDQRYGYAWLQAVRDAHHALLRKQRRLLIVGHDAHPQGAEILCLNFLRFFRHHFHFDVELIVLGDGGLLPQYRQHAMVHKLDSNHFDSGTHRLLAAMRARGAEVAFVNTTVSGSIVPMLKEHGFTVVSLVHEMPALLASCELREHATNIATLSDTVIFPARQVREGFESFCDMALPQAVIRPQGLPLRSPLPRGADRSAAQINARKKLGLPNNARIILGAGYACHRKGFDLFVHASIEIMRRIPHTLAIWIGHPDRSFVDQSLLPAISAGILDHFVLPGQVEDPRDYYLAADTFALTSREDPFPSVVLEALDAMTPVVAFQSCGGFDTLLERGCGLLVPTHDYTAFADAVIKLFENPALIQALAETGRQITDQEFNFRHYLFDLLRLAKRPIVNVSVVVPNYNYEQYIRQRLETVISQTWPIFEIIVLDDCSPDNSPAIIRDILDGCDISSRFERNGHNSGSVFRQWQKGVDLARGDLIWIAEADDLSEPNFLECLVPFFDDPEVVLAYTQSKQIDENGNLLAHDYSDYTYDIGDYWRKDYVIDGSEEVKRAMCIKNTIPNVSGVVFRRSAITTVMKQYDHELETYKVAGDWMLYLRLTTLGKIAFCSKSLNLHRRHIHSVTRQHNHLQEVIDMQSLAAKLVNLEDNQIHAMNTYLTKLKKHFEKVGAT